MVLLQTKSHLNKDMVWGQFHYYHHHYHCHHYQHHYHHYLLLLLLLLLLLSHYTPFEVWDWPCGQWIVCQLFKRGDWVGYTQSTLLPQQLLGRTIAWAIEPAFHWWGLVGQFATGHRHLPQFWISAKSITITLGAVPLCARSPPRGGLQPSSSPLSSLLSSSSLSLSSSSSSSP